MVPPSLPTTISVLLFLWLLSGLFSELRILLFQFLPRGDALEIPFEKVQPYAPNATATLLAGYLDHVKTLAPFAFPLETIPPKNKSLKMTRSILSAQDSEKLIVCRHPSVL